MIKQTTDYEMIREMLLEDKELFDRISDDYTDISKWHPEKSVWVGWFEDGKCLGLLSACEENAIVYIVHINIPLANRGKNSFIIGSRMLEWLIENSDKRFVKINAKIPIIYKDVVRFAEKNGFKKEGVDKSSYIKNGEIHDRVCMGRVIG